MLWPVPSCSGSFYFARSRVRSVFVAGFVRIRCDAGEGIRILTNSATLNTHHSPYSSGQSPDRASPVDRRSPAPPHIHSIIHSDLCVKKYAPSVISVNSVVNLAHCFTTPIPVAIENNRLMETFKLIVAGFLSPMLICLSLQAVGWLIYLRKGGRMSLQIIAAGTLVLTIGGLSGLTYESARAREHAYPPLNIAAGLDTDQPALVVVLGTGFNPDPEMPANSQVSSTFHTRLLEGIRVYRQHSQARLLVSVAGEADAETKRSFFDQMIELLQLDPSRVSIMTEAKSTTDEADEVARQRKNEQIVVVSSAGHMMRAMEIFADAGLDPIAAPSEFWFPRAGSELDKVWPRWIPSTGGINSNHQWLYETAASLWHKISGE